MTGPCFVDGGEATDANTIVLSLDVECTHKAKPRADAVTSEDKYDNAIIYSRDLVFVPQGNQTDSVSYMCWDVMHGIHVLCVVGCGVGTWVWSWNAFLVLPLDLLR
jgi:hypothetical protein